MYKNEFFKKYGIGLSTIKLIYNSYGISLLKNKINLSNKFNNVLQEDLNKFLFLNIEKKEVYLKEKKIVLEKKKKNGSYKGYKYFRGLPMYNQRTKTNSRNSRKKIL